MKFSKIILILVVLSVFSSPLYALQEQIPVINNKEPLNGTAPYAEIKLLHSIPTYDDEMKYGISMIYDMAVDDDGNLYVVSRDEDNITVFNSKGEYVQTIGREGEGPGEFQMPYGMAIAGNEMHVYQWGGHQMQVLDLSGKYIKKFPVDGGNYDFINYFGDYYLTLNLVYTILDQGGRQRNAVVEIRDNNFDLIRNVVSVPQVTSKDKPFSTRHSHIFSSSNIDKYIYFPMNTDEYEITKYDLEGNALLKFTREYEKKNFSKSVMDHKNNLKKWWIEYYDGNGTPDNFRSSYLIDPEKRPWVIRKILIDDRQNVWVIAGEWAGDADFEAEVMSTLDIFSPDGKYLNSQKTGAITYRSIIKNGKIYSLARRASAVADDVHEEIRVFEIKYLDY
ncbi:6-bladed beta-propeller [candidate division KSB1 bacterium]